MLKLGHTATLEFGSVYLKITNLYNFKEHYDFPFDKIKNPFYNIFTWGNDGKIYTNLRWILDNVPELFSDYLNDDLHYCTKFIPSNNDPYKRYTFKIICNRGVSHELVRHRVFSFLQESTRYCNYSKDKFSNELNIIDPFNNFIKTDDFNITCYKNYLESHEAQYNALTITKFALKAQEARGILPNDLKTELYMSGFLKDWVGHNVETYAIDIFDESVDVTIRVGFDTLRRHVSAHPQAREIANLIFNSFMSIISAETFATIKETYYE